VKRRPRTKDQAAEFAEVTVDIRPRPVSPAQKQIWKRLWQKLITEVKANE